MTDENKITKAKIADEIYHRIGGISRKESFDLIEKLLEIMKKTISKGENIKISNFGTFVVKEKKERKLNKLGTKNIIVLPGHKILRFRSSHELKEKMNMENGNET
jgi:integration host factor subunit alpha